ncbi:hypothetical protein [Streptomyces sp. NBC_00162]|uniref:hypothetical protein n=1 Tax=Streptomyces sp. NBC_00162 TaxID=2903629 RepID=UPI00214D0B6D|nr:hypothetical protein [Streptomyces sp. NBC_00162]UUU38683.1 hypothetical protein JIW86_07560 [Streptomyces sp. NBC_00162]
MAVADVYGHVLPVSEDNDKFIQSRGEFLWDAQGSGPRSLRARGRMDGDQREMKLRDRVGEPRDRLGVRECHGRRLRSGLTVGRLPVLHGRPITDVLGWLASPR